MKLTDNWEMGNVLLADKLNLRLKMILFFFSFRILIKNFQIFNFNQQAIPIDKS